MNFTPQEFREARERAGLAQKEVAKLAGLCHVTICRFEAALLGDISRPKTRAGLEKAYNAMIIMPSKRRGKRMHLQKYGPAKEPLAFKGHDRKWLEAQIERAIREESTGVVQRGGLAYFVLSAESVYQLCRRVLLAVGKQVE